MITWWMLLPALAGDPCPIPLTLHTYTPPWRNNDADLKALTTQRSWIGLNYSSKGAKVRVHAVMPNSPAQRAGIQADDILSTINSIPIHSSADANQQLDRAVGPITFSIQRENKPLTVVLERGPADPVFLGMATAVDATPCRDIHLDSTTSAQQHAISVGVFNKTHGFRCTDAHTALRDTFESGDVLMVRGGDRILLTMPGWQTTCVPVSDYDGPNATPERYRALLEDLAKDYIAARHRNP